MTFRLMADRFIFPTAITLMVFGVVMVYSTSSVMAAEKYGDQWHFFLRQAAWAVIGLTIMLAAMNVDYHVLQKPVVIYSLLGVCVGLLIVVLFAPPINHVHRWLRWRFVQFQPSELAKLSLTAFLAYFLSRRMPNDVENYWKTFAPCAALAGVMMGLVVLEPDLGMAVALGGILFVSMFMAGVPMLHQLTLCLPAAPALYYLVVYVSWRLDRIMVFLDPWRDPRGRGFQTIQSMIALGSGGVMGTGFGQGKQKLYYLPEAHTDFIFAEIGEELGLVGVALVVLAFGLILWRGMRAALRAPDTFGTLLGAGITMSIVGQACWNMSVTLGLLPVKGMPLPLVSYGGSSLLLTMAQLGVLLNIARQSGAGIRA
jgi:cell division protein FtsW